jgi:phosphoglycolate phosphatase-like HAD superfamily hydrolase
MAFMSHAITTQIEIINKHIEPGHIRFALFDFDGTISLIREGWQGIMIPMMVDILLETPTRETREEVTAIVTDFVDRLTGKQTIYQMIRLAEEVEKRGGAALQPLAYKKQYHDLLWARIEGRVNGLKQGAIDPEEMMVPGARALLENLRDRSVTLFLASGTDIGYVQDEAKALDVTRYFDGGVFGALDQYENFSKKMIIADMLSTHHLHGRELVTFGDGYVEIEETHAVGGIAVGVATDEVRREGVNDWKRNRLIEAGADIIIPEFREWERLTAYLFKDEG